MESATRISLFVEAILLLDTDWHFINNWNFNYYRIFRDVKLYASPRTALSKAWVWGRSIVGRTVSNPAGGTDESLV